MELFLVFFIAIFVSFLNILHVLLSSLKNPPSHFYLWTGHYFSDYFTYLQVMVQGARGRWLVENPFSTDDYTQTFLGYGPDLLMGKIGGLFRLPPMITYWFFVAFCSFILALLIFLTLHSLLPKKPFYLQFSAFLLTLFATSFFKIKEGKIIPIEAWYAPSHLFERFGCVPRHILDQIIGLLIILILAKTLVKIKQYSLRKIFLQALVIGFLLSLLLSFSFISINLIGAIFLTGSYFLLKSLLLRKREFWRYLFLLTLIMALVLLAVLVVKFFQTQSGVMLRSREFGQLQQVKLSPSFLFLLFVPLVLFSPLGVVSFFRSLSPLRMLIFSLFIISLIFFFSSIGFYLGDTNMRFLTPLMYIFLAVLAILGIEQLTSLFKPTFRKKLVMAVAILLLFYFTLPNIIFFYQNRLNDPSLISIGYIPLEFVEGIEFLNVFPGQTAVLTGTSSLLGNLLPVFADKRVYLGRLIFTPMYERKVDLTSLFYQGKMNPNQAEDFLRKNGIDFVLWSTWDGNFDPLTKYDFLKPIFKNNLMVIFKHET